MIDVTGMGKLRAARRAWTAVVSRPLVGVFMALLYRGRIPETVVASWASS